MSKKIENLKDKLTKEDLETAAYYRWLEKGRAPGDGREDWFEIEDKWKDNIVPIRND